MSKITPKQEKFCQNIVSGMSQADAYRNSFNVKANTKPETCQANASRLMADSMVVARVSEIRSKVIDGIGYDIETAMKEAGEAFNIAKGKENGGAMVAAVTLRSKLHGLLIEKSKLDLTSSVTVTMTPDDAAL